MQWVLQLKKIEKNRADDVNKNVNPPCSATEETEDSEFEESNINDLSQNITSNMTIDDSETLTKSEGKSKESGANLDIQSSLPEVAILDQQSYEIAFILPSY